MLRLIWRLDCGRTMGSGHTLAHCGPNQPGETASNYPATTSGWLSRGFLGVRQARLQLDQPPQEQPLLSPVDLNSPHRERTRCARPRVGEIASSMPTLG